MLSCFISTPGLCLSFSLFIGTWVEKSEKCWHMLKAPYQPWDSRTVILKVWSRFPWDSLRPFQEAYKGKTTFIIIRRHYLPSHSHSLGVQWGFQKLHNIRYGRRLNTEAVMSIQLLSIQSDIKNIKQCTLLTLFWKNTVIFHENMQWAHCYFKIKKIF